MQNGNDYVFLPDYPRYYFAFLDDRFAQFNGIDGTESQSTDNILEGNRKWMYPFGDNQPYLVVTNDNVVKIYRVDITTANDYEIDGPLPSIFSLGRPYPNPFNASQTIPITARLNSHLKVDVYNLLGEKVGNIHNGIVRSSSINLQWDAENLASGIYFIRAVSGDYAATVRSILLK